MKYVIAILGAAALARAVPTASQKLPWIDDAHREMAHECGFWGYSDEMCGTQIYCDAFDSATFNKPTEFKNAQECFNAHEAAPTLPWIAAPTQVRPKWCEKGVYSEECPFECGLQGMYNDGLCGTQAYCDAFDLAKYKPRGYKNAKACFAAHEPKPSETS
ncbi:hypothetical protein HRG_006853 [Hirsutella rhossiliensis]|uniref:Uncharacterized protein n=1 Tax=Hirsutella rhossiliensis TaxID=111463 RepID=A0A9P8SG92_9HYPO|nr:uncharacterized protein HRG_06853 [Hirsutella rhossiliensis]KAH0961773.1 hypothetical protein HRG_06853 [Hirsutella rhossiliensis]